MVSILAHDRQPERKASRRRRVLLDVDLAASEAIGENIFGRLTWAAGWRDWSMSQETYGDEDDDATSKTIRTNMTIQPQFEPPWSPQS